MNMTKFKLSSSNVLAYAIFGLCFLGFFLNSFGEIPTTPLDGEGDTGGWEFSGYFMTNHLEFSPFPTMNFESDRTFYPYGTSAVFQSWGLERDYVVAAFLKAFGTGPWLQLYYLLSQVIIMLGAYWLLRSRVPKSVAIITAVIIPWFNVYALHKYPWHYGISIYHWTSLGIICDFLIFRAFIKDRRLDVSLVLMRVAFTILALGHDIGYIAGLSLTSFVIHSVGLLLVFAIRHIGAWRAKASFYVNRMVQDVMENRVRTGWQLFLISCAGFFIVPLLLEIMIEVKKHHTSSLHQGIWWANPTRIFTPQFSFLNPDNFDLFGDFKDNAEGFSSSAVGWFLLAFGITGLLAAGKRAVYSLPLLVFFGLLLTYHPGQSSVLKELPWHQFSRVGTRFTVIFSTVFALFGLGWVYRTNFLKTKVGLPVVVCLGALFVLDGFGIHQEQIGLRGTQQLAVPLCS